mgnify:CR=1 FL=1
MSCTVCGSSVSCNCSGNRVSCGQSVSYCTTCNGNGCNSCSGTGNCNVNVVPACPQPYYNCAPSCQESNTQKIIINQFAQCLNVVNSWNIPACGLSATLSIPGLTAITIGSYLWDEEFGYFEITAFDSGLQQVTVINHCNEENAAAGTSVPACTCFLNAAPPTEEEPSSTPCVAIDFTAPAVSACIDITLTNTTGILAGDVVQIGSGFYRIAEVKPNDIVNICNDGDGITPGTSVIAQDASGNYQYCLQIISTSPCDRDVVTNAALVVCNSVGQTTTIEVPEDAWILEGTLASGDNFVGAVPLGLPPFCTRLTAPLSIVLGTALMTLTVGSSAGYATGDILQIAGYPSTAGIPNGRLTVTAVPDGTHVTGTMDPVPPASVVVPTGTNVCRIGCCELLQNQIDAFNQTFSTGGTGLGTGSVNSGAPAYTSSYETYTITNNSSQYDMTVIGSFVGKVLLQAVLVTPATDTCVLAYEVDIAINGGGPSTLMIGTRQFAGNALNSIELIPAVNIPLTNVAPGDTATIQIRIGVAWIPTGSTPTSSGNVLLTAVQGTLIGMPTL